MKITRRQLKRIIQEALSEDSSPFPRMPPVTIRARGRVDITVDNVERIIQNAKTGSRIVIEDDPLVGQGSREVFVRHEDGWWVESVLTSEGVLSDVKPEYRDGIRTQLEDETKRGLTIPENRLIDNNMHDGGWKLKRSDRHRHHWIWKLPVDQDLWKALSRWLESGAKMFIVSDSPPYPVKEAAQKEEMQLELYTLRDLEKDLKNTRRLGQAQGDYYSQEDNAGALTKIRRALHDAIRSLDFPNVENKKELKKAINDWVSSEAVSKELDDLIQRVAKR